MEIKIRKLDPVIVRKLDEMAISSGYSSRESFLRARLEQMTALSIIEENTSKYEELIHIVVNTVKDNSNILYKVDEYFSKQGDNNNE